MHVNLVIQINFHTVHGTVFSLWHWGPVRTTASSFLKFLDHTQRHTTNGRTPLDEWSAHRRDLYWTIHNTDNRLTSVPPAGFEPTISAGEGPQTYSIDCTATGTNVHGKKKGKAVQLQAWSGPEGSRKLRFPDFMTTAQDSGKVVSLTHRSPLLPGNAPGTHFCQKLSQPQGHSVIRRILCQWEIPMTPAGIEPATFRFVAQHPNHWVCTVHTVLK